jgi:hypothetical protein
MNTSNRVYQILDRKYEQLISLEHSLFRIDYRLLRAFTLTKHTQIITRSLSTVYVVVLFCIK